MKKIVRISESEINNIVSKVIKEQRDDIPEDVKLSGNDLYKHILKNYIGPVMDEHDMGDDEYNYYDNVIGWGIEKYLKSEEPERKDDWDYRDELENEIKDWWQPI
jgi:hypothetical protein